MTSNNDHQAMLAAQALTATRLRAVLAASAAEIARHQRHLSDTITTARRRLDEEQADDVATRTRDLLADELTSRVDEHEHGALGLLQTELDELARLLHTGRS